MNDNPGPGEAMPWQRPGAIPTSNGPGGAARSYASPNDPVMHAAHDAIVVVDQDQRIVMVNPAAQRMFGCAAMDALGKDLSVFIPQRFRKAHAQHMRQFDASGTAERPMNERGTLTGLRANGEEFPLEATIARMDLADAGGPRRLFIAILRDLTELTRLRDEVASMNRRMQVLFELAPVPIWVVDGERIVFANRACAALFGCASSTLLLGQSIYSLFDVPSQPSVRQMIARALRGELSVSVENECIARTDGAVRHVDIAVAALPDHGQQVVQMALTDITRQNAASLELETSRQELRELSASLVQAREEERRRIAREMHDELGQSLTALQMELSGVHKRVRTETIRARLQAMLALVDDTVASVRRIATDLRPLILDDLGLVAAIQWLVTNWEQRMHIRTSLDLGEDDPPLDEVAVTALYRMVQETLTNVARHAHATKVRIVMRQRAGLLELVVQDNGVGFAESAVHRAGSHGLLGIRERVYMLGGHLEIGNASSGGGRITIRLPLRAADPLGPAGEHPSTAPLPEPGTGNAPCAP